MKKCFDDAIKDLERLNEKELAETLQPLQAIKDNYELWAMDVLSDKKKEEIALMEEQTRVNALKEKHQEKLNEEGQEQGSDDDDFL